MVFYLPRSNNYVARVLSPLGEYPFHNVRMSRCVFIADDDLSFSIAPTYRRSYDDIYSEVQWLSEPEIKLYASLMLAADVEATRIQFYPFPFGIPVRLFPTADPVGWALEYAKPLLTRKLLEPDKLHPGYSYPATNPFGSTANLPLPPIAGGPPYKLRREGIDYERAWQIYKSIKANDDVLIRGLHTLIKASMLHFHYQFMEEAANTLYISLEASFRLVRRKLQESGNKEPSAGDAANYIHDAFQDSHRLTKYFENDYELRIMSFHPENRFGTFPFPPIMADDYYHLFRNLLEVYRYLITGYVQPRA